MDKELLIMNSIMSTPQISQRELSKKTGLSLGTVNILVKKMIREGFIKLGRIPSDRVVYMLTPEGFDEKVNKTKVYIRNHYLAIETMRQQLNELIIDMIKDDKCILLRVDQIELEELLLQVIHVNDATHIKEPAGEYCVISDYDKPNGVSDKERWINIHNYLSVREGV